MADLNYGHPGAAAYDLDNRDWSFARQYTTRNLKQVRTLAGTHPVTTLATPTSTGLSLPHTSANTTGVQKEVKSRVRDNPQLAAAAGLLPGLTLVSAAVSFTSSAYDPLIGSLLSFGSATLEDRYEDPRRIAALPTGEGGNILRLAFLNQERLGWRMDRSVWVDGHTLKEAHCGYWNEEAAPIQQACFAQSEERSSLLAVRLPTRTVLFRPVYHRRAQAPRSSPFYDLPASTIDANPILSIGLNETGGFPHTDVTFNPDFQLQFALVDQSHTWSVWAIEHRRQVDTYSISCLVRGSISEFGNTAVGGEDGWSRILWVADLYTLLVCNRRHLSIVSIRGGSPTYLACPVLFSERSADWILDVKRHPRDRGRVFVLTSTCLALMALTASTEDLRASTPELGVTVLASWRHYRGADDFTLQMSVQMVSDDESCLMLHSHLNNLVQVYTFRETSPGSSMLVSSPDPSVVNLDIDGTGRITEVRMESMQYGDIGKIAYDPGPGRSYREKDIKFFRLYVTLSDLTVHELVVHIQDPNSDEPNDGDPSVEGFKRSIIRHPRRDTSKHEVITGEGEFILPDGLTTIEAPRSKTESQMPKWGQVHTILHGARDNELVVAALSRSEHRENGVPNSVDVEVVTNQIKEMLEDDFHLSNVPLGTLMEFPSMKLEVSDVDEASANLQWLFSTEDAQNLVDVERIASMRVLDLTEGGDSTIANVYDTILQTWVAPLPPDVPIRVRQHKERLARRVAAELMFSSTRIRPKESNTYTNNELQEPTAGSRRGPSQDSGVALPILSFKPKEGTIDNPSPWYFSQLLPTPPYSSIPSSSFPASSPPAPISAPSTPPDPLARLGKHLRNREAPLTPTTLVPNVTQLLGHWQPDADPHTYDWSAIERALQPEALDEESRQQREKERKKKERREKRQQRENELMRAKAISQPALFPRSSPGPMLSGMDSSSQVPTQMSSQVQVPVLDTGFKGQSGRDILGPQSQIEPGKFGGRLDKKKKKKGRVSGF